MAVVSSTIATIAAVAGAGASGYGMITGNRARRQAADASQRQEAIRRQQAELDNRRRMNQIIRETAANRARSVAGATARGISNSSAAAGGLASISTQGGVNALAQSENFGLGLQMFDANAQFSEAQGRAQTAQAWTGFGQTLFGNAQAIGRIGAQAGAFFNNFNDDSQVPIGQSRLF